MYATGGPSRKWRAKIRYWSIVCLQGPSPACSRACCCSSSWPPTSWCATGCAGARCRPPPARRRRSSAMGLEMLAPILLTVISAATPLLFAALGELVVEKSGVLNLGVEGMMLVGAVAGFAVTLTTGDWRLGVLAAAAAGAALALVFAVLTLNLMSNQVATGLALTIFGIGLSSLIGSGFVGRPV